jgi:hypothetical protein
MAEEISFIGEIHKLLDRDPFQPFTIVLNSGDRHEVTDPHQLALGETVAILIPKKSTSVHMRSNQIVGVEVLEPA